MTMQFIGSAAGTIDDDTADHMADALAYLSRVAMEAGYREVAADLSAVRDKVNLIAIAKRARSGISVRRLL